MNAPAISLESAPWYYSATQLELVKACPKKYHLKYVVGLKEPASPGRSLGSAVHEEVEPRLRALYWGRERVGEGVSDIRVNSLADALLQEWSDVSRWQVLDIESDILWEEEGFHWRVKQDLLLQCRNTGLYWVGDHKTSSDIEKYAKTSSQLRGDVQALLYARAFFAHNPELDLIGLRWVYVQTKGRLQTRVVEEVVSRDHVASKFPGILDLARKAEAIRNGEIEPKRERFECGRYGGCPFKEECLGSMFKRREVVGFLKQMREKAKAPEAVEITPEVEAVVDEVMAQTEAVRRSAPPPSTPQAPPAPPSALTAAKEKVAARRGRPPKARPAPASINPPEAPVEVRATAVEVFADEAPVDELPAEKTNPGVTMMIEPRGVSKAKDLPAVRRRVARKELIGALYVDCYPIGAEPPVTLEDIAAMIDPPEEGHYQLIDYKGAALLTLAVLQYLEENPVAAVSMSLQTRLGRDLYSDLVAVSVTVIRGM